MEIYFKYNNRPILFLAHEIFWEHFFGHSNLYTNIQNVLDTALKGLSIVVWDRSHYMEEYEKQLSDLKN